MDLETWIQRCFTITSKINWSCPNCKRQSLEFIKNKFFAEETIKSLDYRNKNEDWETEWIEYNINGLIKCKSCKENIFFIGEGNPIESGYYNDEQGYYTNEYEINFIIKYIHPNIHIFEIPKTCPESVKLEIIDSFKLFWCDLDSCANKIRIALEALMNELKVKKFEIKKTKEIL